MCVFHDCFMIRGRMIIQMHTLCVYTYVLIFENVYAFVCIFRASVFDDLSVCVYEHARSIGGSGVRFSISDQMQSDRHHDLFSRGFTPHPSSMTLFPISPSSSFSQ